MPSQTIPRIDLTGQRFGRLEVIEFAGFRVCSYNKARREAVWHVRCDCGTNKTVAARTLRGGIISCGCSRRKHGHSAGRRGTPTSPTYRSWNSMMTRCYNQEHVHYHRYGGRGIGVCNKWKTFEGFLADMGERPHYKSLDRIDTDKGYSADNCRWASGITQARNRCNNRLVSFNGTTKFAVDWAKEFGVSPRTIWDRHMAGLPINKPIELGKRRRDNQWVVFNGKRKLAKEWAEELGVSRSAVWNRHKNGWPIDQPMPWGTNRGRK